jgi:hypothetical protein
VSTTPPPPAGFCGWHRRTRRAAWQKLCEGATEAEAWRRLLDVLHELGGRGGESCVLPAGRTPTKPPAGSVVGIHRPGRSFLVEPLEPAKPADGR